MGKMFAVTIEVSEEAIADTLCTALEGGSNYWIDHSDRRPYTIPDDPLALSELVLPVAITLLEPYEGMSELVLDKERIKRGLKVFASKFPRFFAAEFPADRDLYNGDADSADVFLQCCLFGEVVFG